MKKKLIIVLSVLIIGIAIAGLYQTFAVNTLITNENDIYNVTLTDNSVVTVPAKSSKIVYYQICNTNKGKVQYGIGYTSSNIVVKSYWDSIDTTSGTIDYGENKYIKLKLINESEVDDTVTLNAVLGYENGGDLQLNEGETLVTEQINEINYLTTTNSTDSFLGSALTKAQIGSVTFVNDNIVPAGNYISTGVAKNGSETIRLWYLNEADSEGLYDVYIGSDNGIVSLSTGKSLFSDMTAVKSIKFNDYIDTSSVTDMYAMFWKCNNLTSLDISSLKTNNVTNMTRMFANCSSLETLDVSNLNTSKTKGFESMFSGCTKLIYLDVSNFDTSNATSFYEMFNGCSSLETLDVSNWNTANVTSMPRAFNGCKNLTSLDVSNWNTSKTVNINETFSGCGSLKEIDVTNWNTSSLQNIYGAFSGCSSLMTIDMRNWDKSKIKESMKYLFKDCTSLKSVYLGEFDASNLTDISQVFQGCSSLTELDLSNFKTSQVKTLSSMFEGCKSLTELDLSGFYTPELTAIGRMFAYCTSLKKVDFRNATFANVTAYVNAFAYSLPTDIEVIIKDTELDKFTTMFPTFPTNITTISTTTS